MKQILFVVIIFFLVGFNSCQTGAKKTEVQELPEKLVDRIQLVDLEGNEILLSNFKGKTIFLNYWATWCRPCLAEMPDIDKAKKILENEDFVFIAASDEDLEKIKEFVAKNDYSFQIVQSKTSVFDLDISAFPTTFVINKEGEIVYNEVGARDWAAENTLKKLRMLAEE